MNSIWEAVKTAFSGIFNWGTIVGLFGGVVIYVFVCGITICCEDKELFMRLLAKLQLRLGISRNRCTKHVASWLWTRIIQIDYARRCQLTEKGDDEEEQFWQLLQLPYLRYAKKKIIRVCQIVATRSGISERVVRAAEVCLEKMEYYA